MATAKKAKTTKKAKEPEVTNKRLDTRLVKAAKEVTAAKPKTSSAVLTFFRITFLPLLPMLLAQLIEMMKGNKTFDKIMEKTRETLAIAYGDDASREIDGDQPREPASGTTTVSAGRTAIDGRNGDDDDPDDDDDLEDDED